VKKLRPSIHSCLARSTPPSATQPLPRDETVTAAAPPPAPDIGQGTASNARMAYPVKGKIIRPYAKGKNEGIDISAAPGTEVSAAASGNVAAITGFSELRMRRTSRL